MNANNSWFRDNSLLILSLQTSTKSPWEMRSAKWANAIILFNYFFCNQFPKLQKLYFAGAVILRLLYFHRVYNSR